MLSHATSFPMQWQRPTRSKRLLCPSSNLCRLRLHDQDTPRRMASQWSGDAHSQESPPLLELLGRLLPHRLMIGGQAPTSAADLSSGCCLSNSCLAGHLAAGSSAYALADKLGPDVDTGSRPCRARAERARKHGGTFDVPTHRHGKDLVPRSRTGGFGLPCHFWLKEAIPNGVGKHRVWSCATTNLTARQVGDLAFGQKRTGVAWSRLMLCCGVALAEDAHLTKNGFRTGRGQAPRPRSV